MALTVSPLFVMPTSYLIMNTKSADYAGLISWLDDEWKEINAESPFTYSFLDDDFQRNYEKETQTLSLIRYFTFIAIVIACLGLLGLASFTAGQRVKEIGVRKILGASVGQVVILLSKDFMILVAIAIAFASPIGYYLIDKWLQGFAYHIDIDLSVFVMAGMSAVAIAFITISMQTIKAAISNPVDSLRSE
jgi:putative ABC transport system permease protein